MTGQHEYGPIIILVGPAFLQLECHKCPLYTYRVSDPDFHVTPFNLLQITNARNRFSRFWNVRDEIERWNLHTGTKRLPESMFITLMWRHMHSVCEGGPTFHYLKVKPGTLHVKKCRRPKQKFDNLAGTGQIKPRDYIPANGPHTLLLTVCFSCAKKLLSEKKKSSENN